MKVTLEFTQTIEFDALQYEDWCDRLGDFRTFSHVNPNTMFRAVECLRRRAMDDRGLVEVVLKADGRTVATLERAETTEHVDPTAISAPTLQAVRS